MSLRDDILALEDLPRQPVDVPEWGTTVYVRAMTGSERDKYEASLIDKKDLPMHERMLNMRSTLVVLCTVDEDGERVFNDNDTELVGAKSANALDRIVQTAQELNVLADAQVEEIAGN